MCQYGHAALGALECRCGVAGDNSGEAQFGECGVDRTDGGGVAGDVGDGVD